VTARVRAVLFDAVGTLIRLREPVGATYARAARSHGVALAPAALTEAFHRSFAEAPPMLFPGVAPERAAALERGWWRALVRATFTRAGAGDLASCQALFDRLWDRFAAPEAWRVAEGASAALAELRRAGVATGVVSNFDARLPALLAGLGLAPLLDTVALPSRAGALKPDPAIFRAATDALRCAPSEGVHVGDDPATDLAGARAAGLLAIDAHRLATLADLPAHVLRGSLRDILWEAEAAPREAP
jgi:putative hydrolase of the HAD superfamily